MVKLEEMLSNQWLLKVISLNFHFKNNSYLVENLTNQRSIPKYFLSMFTASFPQTNKIIIKSHKNVRKTRKILMIAESADGLKEFVICFKMNKNLLLFVFLKKVLNANKNVQE